MYKSAKNLQDEFDQVAQKMDPNKSKAFRMQDPLINYLYSQLPPHGELAMDIGCGIGDDAARLA